jgi:magnesium chelatase family protein
MIARVLSMGLTGIDGYPVTVEVDYTDGMPFFEIVGLPDAAVKESRERVFSALRNSGFHFEMQRIILNMAPADVRKEGPIYDLPIALGLLAAMGSLRPRSLEGMMFLGELSLTGEVRPVRGALPMVLAAREAGMRRAALPWDNAAEGACVEGMDILAVKTLRELVTLLNSSSGNLRYVPHERWSAEGGGPESDMDDISRIKGQYGAKRALEVAAAGGHNLLMIGPPGSGKSMMARTIPTILPDLTFEEAIEVTKVYSISGELERNAVIRKRPVRSPHHTATTVSLAGGGNPVHPGDISMAHCGVLFMDEFPEFNRNALEVLRQPLEDGKITIARATGSYRFPARFMLVAAMNPCPCGYFGSKARECRCTQQQITNYLSRISGPLLDRMDIQVEVGAVEYSQLTGTATGEPSSAVRARVNAARKLQEERLRGQGMLVNAGMGPKQLEEYCALDAAGHAMMEKAFKAYGLSARAFTRILKVARTIADLSGAEGIGDKHLAEAIQYRVLDRKYWGQG